MGRAPAEVPNFLPPPQPPLREPSSVIQVLLERNRSLQLQPMEPSSLSLATFILHLLWQRWMLCFAMSPWGRGHLSELPHLQANFHLPPMACQTLLPRLVDLYKMSIAQECLPSLAFSLSQSWHVGVGSAH